MTPGYNYEPLTTWRTLLQEVMDEDPTDPGPVIAYAPDEETFDIEFDSSFGTSSGPSVLAWTKTRVYFPVVYDGAEWLAWAPRNPQPEGQDHVGSQ